MNKKRVLLIIILAVVLLVVVGITFLVCYLLSKYADHDFLTDLTISLIVEGIVTAISIAVSFASWFIKSFSEARDYDYKTEYKNQKIRLSFAYLIRIKVNNRYLLVKGGHGRDIFGPVGGVYHIEKTDYVYKKLGYARDETPGDPDDVRGTINGQNVAKFIRWFNKRKNREVCPNREFDEELIDSGIVDKGLFKDVSFSFVNTKYRGIQLSTHYRKLELCRFDVYELSLNPEQISHLSSLKSKKIKLATREEIESCGVDKNNDKRTIGDQTVYILEE